VNFHCIFSISKKLVFYSVWTFCISLQCFIIENPFLYVTTEHVECLMKILWININVVIERSVLAEVILLNYKQIIFRVHKLSQPVSQTCFSFILNHLRTSNVLKIYPSVLPTKTLIKRNCNIFDLTLQFLLKQSGIVFLPWICSYILKFFLILN
jgi:hypothetical protein